MDNYCNVLTETNEILNYFDKTILEKIPQKLRQKIRESKNDAYKFKYDKSKTLIEQNIMPETKDLISAIYLMYCCDGEKRQQLMDICKENERKTMEYLNQSYDISELFKKTKEVVKENTEENIESTDNVVNNKIAIIEEENWYNKLYTKIKSFFNRIFGK